MNICIPFDRGDAVWYAKKNKYGVYICDKFMFTHVKIYPKTQEVAVPVCVGGGRKVINVPDIYVCGIDWKRSKSTSIIEMYSSEVFPTEEMANNYCEYKNKTNTIVFEDDNIRESVSKYINTSAEYKSAFNEKLSDFIDSREERDTFCVDMFMINKS